MQRITDMPELRGFRSVRVPKDKLMETIKSNRNEHRRIFEEAIEGWKERVTKDLETAAEEAKAGRSFRIRFNLPKPEDHTKDYDAVIDLLEFSLDDEFELSFNEFNQYVRDEWGWQTDFLNTSMSYGSMSATDKFNDMQIDESSQY